jgi:hypothetical protein
MTDRNFKFEGACSGQSDMNETLDPHFDAALLLCWSIRTPYPIASALYGADCNVVVHTIIKQMRDTVTSNLHSN